MSGPGIFLLKSAPGEKAAHSAVFQPEETRAELGRQSPSGIWAVPGGSRALRWVLDLQFPDVGGVGAFEFPSLKHTKNTTQKSTKTCNRGVGRKVIGCFCLLLLFVQELRGQEKMSTNVTSLPHPTYHR